MNQSYSYSSNNTFVTFSLETGNNPFISIQKIVIRGSFTKWQERDTFVMEKKGNNKWSVTVSAEKLQQAGNCGYPEYNYIIYYKLFGIIDKISYFTANANNTNIKLIGNFILLPPEGITETEAQRLRRGDKIACTIKKLKQFDLTDRQQHYNISNFRKVPGTANLYRGYHPYKKSHPDYDTEKTRLEFVNSFIQQSKVQSIITLSGRELLDPKYNEFVYPYVKQIQENDNQCFIDTSYETVYFDCLSEEYNNTVKTICQFIASHDGPFYIHCRLGSDRTGTMSAVLACLCGASWNEIAEDYEKTCNLGIGEYRNRKLLACMFKQLLKGKEPSEVEDLTQEVKNHFIKTGILSEELINQVVQKLQTNTSSQK